MGLPQETKNPTTANPSYYYGGDGTPVEISRKEPYSRTRERTKKALGVLGVATAAGAFGAAAGAGDPLTMGAAALAAGQAADKSGLELDMGGLFDQGDVPRAYVGGSPEAQKKREKQANARMDAARKGLSGALNKGEKAGDAALKEQQGFAKRNIAASDTAAGRATTGANRYLGGDKDYAAGRTATLANAGNIEGIARDLPGSYQQTADKMAAFQRDQNTRAALSAASSGGGQLAMRNALAASAGANTDAAIAAEMTRAQEMNQLRGMQAAMYGQAAGIRQGVGTQDLSRAGLGAQYAVSQAAQRSQANAQASDAIFKGTAQVQDAAKMTAMARANQEDRYLGAQVDRDVAQLTADREANLLEAERQRSWLGQLGDPGGFAIK